MVIQSESQGTFLNLIRKAAATSPSKVPAQDILEKQAAGLDIFAEFIYFIFMQLTRGSVFLVFLVVFVGCQTPFQMGRNADDPDDRYGLKPGNAAANLDSDNVYTRPQRTAPSENPAPPDLGSTVRLKPFRSTQRPSPEPTATPRPRISPSPTPKSQSTPGPIPKPKPTPKTEDAVSHDDSPPTEPASNVTTEKAPFASPVPGKKGYVTSPFSPGAGFIDVTGMEPGTEAKDPYTGKVFRVP